MFFAKSSRVNADLKTLIAVCVRNKFVNPALLKSKFVAIIFVQTVMEPIASAVTILVFLKDFWMVVQQNFVKTIPNVIVMKISFVNNMRKNAIFVIANTVISVLINVLGERIAKTSTVYFALKMDTQIVVERAIIAIVLFVMIAPFFLKNVVIMNHVR